MADLKYLHSFTDRHGKRRYYVRSAGRRIALPSPGREETPSPAFLNAYNDAVDRLVKPRRVGDSKPRPVGQIYVAGYGRYVKIGFTTNIKQRLAFLSTGSPERIDLRLLIPGNEEAERRLHTRFAKYRRNGEWFSLAGDLKAWLQSGGRS